MNNQDLIIIALVIALIYLYYQQTKKYQQLHSATSDLIFNPAENSKAKIFELDEELIAEKDEAVRKKNEAEAEALDLGNKLKLKQQEVTRKDAEITRLKDEKSKVEIALNEKIKKVKEDLTSEKQQHKGSLARIVKLTEQKAELEKEQQEQLRKINLLFDEQAKDYKTIEFNGLYSLLEKVKLEKPEIKETPIEVDEKKEEVD